MIYHAACEWQRMMRPFLLPVCTLQIWIRTCDVPVESFTQPPCWRALRNFAVQQLWKFLACTVK